MGSQRLYIEMYSSIPSTPRSEGTTPSPIVPFQPSISFPHNHLPPMNQSIYQNHHLHHSYQQQAQLPQVQQVQQQQHQHQQLLPPIRLADIEVENIDMPIVNPNHRTGPWAEEEDRILIGEVKRNNPSPSWSEVSIAVGTRNPKQCRERWHQNLDPRLDHSPIRPEEIYIINQMVAQRGQCWAEIARALVNRSDNFVKNYWNGSKNRRRRHNSKDSTESRGWETATSSQSSSPSARRRSTRAKGRRNTRAARQHKMSIQFLLN